MDANQAIDQLHDMAVNGYPDDVEAVAVVRQEIQRLTAELAQCRRDYQTYVDGVRTAEQAEIERLTAELHDCQHERERNRAVAEQTRGSVAEVDAMLDRWAAEAEERGGG